MRYYSTFLVFSSLTYSLDIGSVGIIEDKYLPSVQKFETSGITPLQAVYFKTPGLQITNMGAGKDISLKGLSQDNIAVTIDGCRIFGGCPSRMDSPINHVSNTEKQKIQLVEGPFDVSHFGTFGGILKFSGSPDDFTGLELKSSLGSFDSHAARFRIGMGSDRDHFLIQGGREKHGMPKDGSNRLLSSFSAVPYKDPGQDYSFDEEISIKYRFEASRKTQVTIQGTKKDRDISLFPARMMDGVKDDNRRLEIAIKHVLDSGKTLDFSWFHNRVDHVMDNFTFRNTMAPMRMESITEASQSGFRLVLEDGEWETGLERFARDWQVGRGAMQSLDAETRLYGFWAQKEWGKGIWDYRSGIRIDLSESTDNQRRNPGRRSVVHRTTESDKEETLFSAFLSLSRPIADKYLLSLDLGSAQRPVDPMEHWFQRMDFVGNPHLKAPRINEAKLGYSKQEGRIRPGISVFHRDLEDHILPSVVLVGGQRVRTYENIDAEIQGISLSLEQDLSRNLVMSLNVTRQKGNKKSLPTGSNTLALAEIPDITGRIELAHTSDKNTIRLWGEFASEDSDIDTNNGEQRLGGYAFVNASITRQLSQDLKLEFRVDNLLDKMAVRHNSYDRDPVNQVVRLLPEAGRSFWVSLTQKF